jgi:hypothetical protein
MKTFVLALGLVATSILAGCGDADEGTGSVAFSTWGEEYIEQEIPAADVEDGWAIHFDKFLVDIGRISIAEEGGSEAAEMKGSFLFDHTKAGVKPLQTFANLPARAFAHVSFEIAPVTADTQVAGVSETDKSFMASNGYSVYVEANATKGSVSKRFVWGFTTATLYDRCKGELGGKETDGVVVTNGGTDQAEITIHGDHFFYDDLQANEAKVRFDNLAAADADMDGTITMAELAQVKLAAIPREKGTYGTGSASGIDDLATFVTALSRTVGHFRGEGECFASAKSSGHRAAEAP